MYYDTIGVTLFPFVYAVFKRTRALALYAKYANVRYGMLLNARLFYPHFTNLSNVLPIKKK